MKAIVLLSGGLDSTVMLAIALSTGRQCLALSFDYGQRHRIELTAAQQIAKHYNVSHQIIKIDPASFQNSALVTEIAIPQNRSLEQMNRDPIPSTYVPGRNTLFLAYANAQAEIHDADEIYFGPNAMDYHCYVDCRPEFVEKFQDLINIASKKAIEEQPPKIIAPLIKMTKPEIVQRGMELNVPIELTWSCYNPAPGPTPCRTCDACVIRDSAITEIKNK